jgi:hypothetical protein
MEQTIRRETTPVHLWIVGLLGLVWNGFGGYDYVMTQTDPVNYLATMGLGQESVDYMRTFPAWLTVFWALGVWGSLAGSILLLLRSRHALTAFAVSLGAFVVSQVAELVMPRPVEMDTAAMWGTVAFIAVAIVGQLLYARRQAAVGVLR